MHQISTKGYISTFLALLIVALACSPAHAYLGPGGAVSGIGALLALIGVIFLSIIGFVWYPVKRMLTGKHRASEVDDEDDEDSQEEPEKP